MNRLQTAVTMVGAFLVVSYGQTSRAVDVIDSTFDSTNALSGAAPVTKHFYATNGKSSVDSNYSKTGTIISWDINTLDASGNVLTKLYDILSGGHTVQSWEHFWTYNNANQIIVDSIYDVPGNPPPPGRVRAFNLDNWTNLGYSNGKHTVDSVFLYNGNKDGYSVYVYSDSGYVKTDRDSTGKRTAVTEYILNSSDTIIKTKNFDTTGTTLNSYTVRQFDSNNHNIKSITYNGSGVLTGYTTYTWGTITIAVRYGLQHRTAGSLISGLLITAGQNKSTSVSFELKSSATVRVQLYDMSGKIVSTLAKGMLGEGSYTFRMHNLSFGTNYILRVTTGTSDYSQQFSIN